MKWAAGWIMARTAGVQTGRSATLTIMSHVCGVVRRVADSSTDYLPACLHGIIPEAGWHWEDKRMNRQSGREDETKQKPVTITTVCIDKIDTCFLRHSLRTCTYYI